MAILKIVRDSGYADRLRAYKVIVDGKTAGEIRDGETKEFPISDGQHELSLKIDWCGSSNLRGPKLVAALWYALFARSSYLRLERR